MVKQNICGKCINLSDKFCNKNTKIMIFSVDKIAYLLKSYNFYALYQRCFLSEKIKGMTEQNAQ